MRYPLADATVHIGRAPENDVPVQGATVSLYHLEISKDGETWRLKDVGSTNGTFLDGQRVTEAELHSEAIIRLGVEGPEFLVLTEESGPSDFDRTLVVPKGVLFNLPVPAETPGTHETLLSEAVSRARRARALGGGDLTMTLMRDVLDRALRRSGRRFRSVIACLVLALLAVSGYGYWKITQLRREKTGIDQHIAELEGRLEAMQLSPDEADRLIAELSAYQNEAQSLEKSALYKYAVKHNESFVSREIRTIMQEFGAEAYSVPPEFRDRVNHYIDQYQGADRPVVERALNDTGGRIETMRRILEEEKLPPDLVYVALVESAMAPRQASVAGAAGLWQLTPATARAVGLRVEGGVDERHDLRKSTRAGCRYLRELILDFGSGSSVMLALAAYNFGPTRVKQAVMRVVEDPIKQRNFWYLYRARALPPETREYVPKVFAAIIIGRNAERFGF